MHYLTIFLFMQWDYGKFILKQLDSLPSFSTSDSQLGCASLIKVEQVFWKIGPQYVEADPQKNYLTQKLT